MTTYFVLNSIARDGSIKAMALAFEVLKFKGKPSAKEHNSIGEHGHDMDICGLKAAQGMNGKECVWGQR